MARWKKHAWEGYVVLLGRVLTILTLREAFWEEKNLIPQHFQHLLICAGCSVQKGYSV